MMMLSDCIHRLSSCCHIDYDGEIHHHYLNYLSRSVCADARAHLHQLVVSGDFGSAMAVVVAVGWHLAPMPAPICTN
jgi:hypothetical protein